ncbi:unnamed protein product [Rotaria magnacalcarata]
MSSRTSESDMQVLINFYRLFHPSEISFILDLNVRLSKLDPTRINFITENLRQIFNTQHNESDVRALISFFSNPHNTPQIKPTFNLDSILLSHAQAHPIEPFTEQCPLCNCPLNSDHVYKKNVFIYKNNGQVIKGVVHYLQCDHSNNHKKNVNGPIRIYPNYIQEKNIRNYTSLSIQHGLYIYLGGDYACERELVERYTSDLVSTPHSWQKQADSLNNLAFSTARSQATPFNMRRFSQLVFTYKIIEMDLCLGSTNVATPKDIDEFDLWAWSEYPRLLSRFIYLWSNHRTLIGACNIPGDKCSACFTIDGHQKARRRVCRSKQVNFKSSDFSEPLVIGCWRTPIRNSLYCELHQNDEKLTKAPRTNQKHTHAMKLRNSRQWQRQKNIFFGATNCSTTKARSESYINKCSRSFGLLAMVTNCRVIISFSEIFRSETLREIIQLLINTIRISDNALPKIACYDDGCHLVRFVQRHVGKLITDTPASNTLKNTKFYIDKAHWKNHVGTWCKENMSPYATSDLNMINTQSAEQLFSWLKRYAPIISSLGWLKAPLYLLVLFHYKNLWTCKVRPTRHFDIANMVPDSATISLPHAANTLRTTSAVSSSNSDGYLSQAATTKHDPSSHTVNEYKWAQMSKEIQFNNRSSSENFISNTTSNVDNKWATIIHAVDSTQQQKIKRDRSPNIINKWATQAEQLAKRQKH